MQFTFAEVVHTLAQTYGIADEKRGAFSARLQHLQKLKFPAGTNTGRGRAAKYDVGHLFLLGVALELGQLGLTPDRAKRVIESDMHAVAMSAYMVATDRIPDMDLKFDSPMFLYCDPAVLKNLTKRNDEEDWAEATFFYAGLGQVEENFRNWFTHGAPRMALFSVSSLVYEISLEAVKGEADVPAFYAALATWASPYIHNQVEEEGDGCDS